MRDRWTNLVRTGYDLIAPVYHAERVQRERADEAWLDSIMRFLPASGTVIDLGCGAGVPVTRYFARRGYHVTGYDLSESMLDIARGEVPEARFERLAMQDVSLPAGSIDLITSFFAIIHIDRSFHGELFRRMHEWLKPGGEALLCLGANDSEYWREENWHGAPMSWSHFDAETNLDLLRKAGFDIIWSAVEQYAPDERHLGVVAQKPT